MSELAVNLDLFDQIQPTEDAIPCEHDDISSLMDNLLGESHIMRSLNHLFDRMAIAEEVIKEMIERYPLDEPLINDSFKYLCLQEDWYVPDIMYRDHARELILRQVNHQDLRPGTRTECLIAMSKQSQKAPFNNLGNFVYVELFKEIFKDSDYPFDYPFISEPYDGAGNELLAQLQQKLAHDRDVTLN